MRSGGEAAVETETCGFPGCGLAAERAVEGVGPLCAGHRKQHVRGRRLEPLLPKDPRARLRALETRMTDALDAVADVKAQLQAEVLERGLAWRDADSENDREYRSRLREYVACVDVWAQFRARMKRNR